MKTLNALSASAQGVGQINFGDSRFVIPTKCYIQPNDSDSTIVIDYSKPRNIKLTYSMAQPKSQKEAMRIIRELCREILNGEIQLPTFVPMVQICDVFKPCDYSDSATLLWSRIKDFKYYNDKGRITHIWKVIRGKLVDKKSVK